jgi:ABC-type dipeptide/oligopeptide/nickel transport system ATPase subunit
MEGSDTGNVPALLAEPSNRKQILRFVRQWKSLKQRDRRMIKKAGVIFDDPYEALEAIKKVMNILFLNMYLYMTDVVRVLSLTAELSLLL